MNCPKCKTSLEQIDYEGAQIDKCNRCNGTWLDDGEIVRIVKTREETFSPELVKETLALAFSGIPKEEQINVVNCPKCNSGMEPINYDYSSGIILDRCPNCQGLWLDGGELEKVQIVRELSEEDFEKNKEDWLELAKFSLSDKENIADENRRRNMRPTKYLVNSLIRKIVR